MNFNSLVWYSSLAIGDEKNNYVADFLNRSCELINEEINEEIELLNQISHLAHEDTGFHSKVIEIKEASKLLKK